MKLVLSRKGFDAAAGGVPSPILPDGTLCSLPIPDERGCPYREIGHGDSDLGELVAALTRGRLDGDSRAHCDPDLVRAARPRRRGWRPCFGQTGSAQSHLAKHGVGPGDLFLYFGWFRQTECRDGTLAFVRGAADVHAIFGWLQIERVVTDLAAGETLWSDGAFEPVPGWAAQHPHVTHAREFGPRNALYVATETLSLPGLRTRLPGGGTFARYEAALRLTEPGRSRGTWRLPGWWRPRRGRPALSYHATPERWEPDGDDVLLRTVGRGQEFVLDCDDYPEAMPWLAGLLRRAAS